MAVKTIYDSVDPVDHILTFFLYDALPQIEVLRDKQNPSTIQRAAAPWKSTKEMSKRFS